MTNEVTMREAPSDNAQIVPDFSQKPHDLFTELASKIRSTRMDEAGDNDELVMKQIAPSVASWFRSDSIHQIEKNALPEFFSMSSTKSKTPEIYLMVRLYLHMYAYLLRAHFF